MSESHILSAFTFKDGKSFELKTSEVALELKNEDLCWVHLNANNPKSDLWLKKEVYYLDEIITDAILAEETRPRLVEFEKGSLVILRGVNLNKNADPEDMVSVRIWVDKNRIITAQKRNIKGLKDIIKKVKAGKSFSNSGEFICDLCYELSDHLQATIDELCETTDEIEDKILGGVFDKELREDVVNNKRQAIMIRRHIAPQKEVINSLKNCHQDWISKDDKRHLQEISENLLRHIEDLDEIKERTHVVHDEMISATNRKLNGNMYALSLIAAIFMPLTLISGLFGMNVGGIPFNDSSVGFWLISVALFFIAISPFIWWRKMLKNF